MIFASISYPLSRNRLTVHTLDTPSLVPFPAGTSSCVTILPIPAHYPSPLTLPFRDKQLRVFDFKRGKMKRKYDESVEAYQVGPICLADVSCPTCHQPSYFVIFYSREETRLFS